MSQPYLDTGLVLKLVINEPLSETLQKWLNKRRISIPYSRLIEVEFENTLQAKCFRAEIDIRQIRECQKLLRDLLSEGKLFRPELSLDEVMLEALELMPQITPQTGCRTLDLLHVVSAKKLGYSEFVTTDKRQASAAQLLGLEVTEITAVR